MAATASPTATPRTPWPAATTTPERSRPRRRGGVRQLVFQWVERRGSNADQHLVGRRPRDRATHRFERKSGPFPRVADAKKRLRDRMCLLHVWLSCVGAPGFGRLSLDKIDACEWHGFTPQIVYPAHPSKRF